MYSTLANRVILKRFRNKLIVNTVTSLHVNSFVTSMSGYLMPYCINVVKFTFPTFFNQKCIFIRHKYLAQKP